MCKKATGVLLMVFLVGAAMAQQDVTVRQINAIPQAGIDALNVAGPDLMNGDISGANCSGYIYVGTLCGQEVRFTAVVMSDPLNSGLASVSGGVVGRIHVFVRDVNAATDGPEGMGMQIVDGSNAFGLENLIVGDEIEVIGNVNPFFTTMQVSPTAINPTGGFWAPGDPIFDPIVLSTADLNKSVGPDGAIQVNWDNLADVRGNLVRIEGATVLQRTLGDRVDWNWSSDGGTTSVAMYDTSLRYRNDRDDYPANFDVRTSTYEPPPPGARINIQGFVTYNGVTSSDPFSLGLPNGAALAMNPFEDSDVEVTEAPIAVGNIQRPSVVPGNSSTQILADITVDPSRAITAASINWTTNSDPAGGSATTVGWTDDTYRFNLPAQADGDFGEYWFTARDSGGAEFESERFPFRTLYGGITRISHIQRTSNDQEGDGPFRDWTVDMNIVATVALDPATGENYIQDSMDPWSGVQIRTSSSTNELSGLAPGDVINITRARIQESFGNTRIRDIDFTVVSQGGPPMAHTTLTTNVLADRDIAESYEGMLVRVEDVYITATNSDDPSGPFGEFDVSSDNDPNNGLRVDDASDLVSYTGNDPGTVFVAGQQLDYVQGALGYTFGNFKLIPTSLELDVGAIINTDTEELGLPQTFVLNQNFPNPFNPSTQISYEIPAAGLVSLDVFDSLGRRVRSLVQAHQLPGRYDVSFDASGLASGVYLYKLVAGEHLSTRAMILLK